IRGTEQLVIPIMVESSVAMMHAQNRNYLISGASCGLIFIMIFYNIFIYFSTKERSYLYYIFYIFFIGLTQVTLSGLTFETIFRNSPRIFNYTIIVLPSLAGIAAAQFVRAFLNTKKDYPKWDKTLMLFAGLYLIAAGTRLFG